MKKKDILLQTKGIRKVYRPKEIVMKKGLIFDLDGVLVDTAKYHYLAWKDLADELAVNFTLEDNERLKGVSRVESFQIILDIGGIEMPYEEQEIYCTKKNTQYLHYINQLTKEDCLPGVYEFLTDAKEKGYKLALGSASKNAPFILERLGLTRFFDIIVDGNSVTKAKPDPEVFVKGATGLALDAEDCVVFEDAIAGIEAAKAAGMMAVGIGSKQVLKQADVVYEGLENITINEIIESRERHDL